VHDDVCLNRHWGECFVRDNTGFSIDRTSGGYLSILLYVHVHFIKSEWGWGGGICLKSGWEISVLCSPWPPSKYIPTLCSYLKSLIPTFNGCVDRFLEWLKIQAKRKRTVLMRKELGAITLQILGKVRYHDNIVAH
jgi:hypothetical protein